MTLTPRSAQAAAGAPPQPGPGVRRGLRAVGGQPLLRPAHPGHHREVARDQPGHRRPDRHLLPDRLRRRAGPPGAPGRPGGPAAHGPHRCWRSPPPACWSRPSPPGIGVLIAVALIVGAGSVVAQVLVPMAASLATEEYRGRVVGTVMSGLLLGILLARTVSGLVAGVSSWRVVYVMAAVLTVAMAVVLGRVLPARARPPPHRVRHPAGHHRPAAGHRAAAAAPGPLRRPRLRRLQRLLDHHGVHAGRGALPLRRHHHRALRPGGGGGGPVRQHRRTVGRPGDHRRHHPGLRRSAWRSPSSPCGSGSTTWPC